LSHEPQQLVLTSTLGLPVGEDIDLFSVFCQPIAKNGRRGSVVDFQGKMAGELRIRPRCQAKWPRFLAGNRNELVR